MPVQINFNGGPFDGEGQMVDSVVTGMGNTITVYTDGDGATGTYTYVSPNSPPFLDVATGQPILDGSGNPITASYNFAYVPPL